MACTVNHSSADSMLSAGAVSAEAATEHDDAGGVVGSEGGGSVGQVVDRESVHVQVRRDRVVGSSEVVGADLSVLKVDDARNADRPMTVDLRVLRCAVADHADDEAVLHDDGGPLDDPVGQHRPDVGDAVVHCHLQSRRLHTPTIAEPRGWIRSSK